MRVLGMKNCWGSTTAVLCIVVVWQLGSAESWSPTFQTLVSQAPPTDDICPLDFEKLGNYPWVAETCQKWPPDEYINSTYCCNALLSAMGSAEAQLLEETNIFRLSDVGIVRSCLQQLQTRLESMGLKYKAVDECFPETLLAKFVTNNSLCLGIETAADFEERVGMGNITDLRGACAGDLTDSLLCRQCNNQMLEVNTLLSMIPQNVTGLGMAYGNLTENITVGSDLDGRLVSDCFYDMVLYTAGKITSHGPWSDSTANCVLAMKLTDEFRHLLTTTEIVVIGLSSCLFSSVVGCVVFSIWYMRRRKAEAHVDFIDRNNKMLKSAERPNIGLIRYKYREIRAATSGFSPANLIGAGGFGSVYKGVMGNGLEVAVKRIHNVTEDGDADFLNEVEIINRVRHRNLVSLRGCCVTSNAEDGHQRLLVYDYMANGSLDKILRGQPGGIFLTWANRVKIIIGVAKGLAHLHNYSQPSIIHADIKPANIVLDEELNAKLTDFGLARSTDGSQSQSQTIYRRGGTPGYVAPEFALYGQLTEKSDVYSFGVVMLDLLTGRKALDPSKESTRDYAVTEWAASMIQDGKVWEVVDERIRFIGPKEKMQTYVMIACMCSQKIVTLRPTFQEVLKYLLGELPLPTMTLPVQHYGFDS